MQRHWEKARIYLRARAAAGRERGGSAGMSDDGAGRGSAPTSTQRSSSPAERARVDRRARAARDPSSPRTSSAPRRSTRQRARGIPGGARSLRRPPRSLAGQAFGAYTLGAPIGHGGMGSVWLARRSDGRFEGTRRGQAPERQRSSAAPARRASAARARSSRGWSTRTSPACSTPACPSRAAVPRARVRRGRADRRLLRRARARRRGPRAPASSTCSPPWRTRTRTSSCIATSSRPTSSSAADGEVKLLDFGIAKLLEGATARRTGRRSRGRAGAPSRRSSPRPSSSPASR